MIFFSVLNVKLMLDKVSLYLTILIYLHIFNISFYIILIIFYIIYYIIYIIFKLLI